MAVLILTLTYFIFFVATPHPFGVIVAFFLGCFMVTGGWFSHPFDQIMILISLLVWGRTISTATILVSFPLGNFNLHLLPLKILVLAVFLSRFIFHLMGASAPNFCIQDVSTAYCNWSFHHLLLYHPLHCFHMNERVVYHWVSCTLVFQYDPGIQKSEWYII